jgi:hypothetical protein
MTLTESRPNDLVTINVDFVKPFAGATTRHYQRGIRPLSRAPSPVIRTSSRRRSAS